MCTKRVPLGSAIDSRVRERSLSCFTKNMGLLEPSASPQFFHSTCVRHWNSPRSPVGLARSLVMTAKAISVNPRTYLRDVLLRIAEESDVRKQNPQRWAGKTRNRLHVGGLGLIRTQTERMRWLH